MRICILETDRPSEALEAVHGTYAAMFERWLGQALPEARFARLHVCGGEALPEEPADFDGYLITGSRAGAYEDHEWIAPLTAFLRRAAARRVPVTGICFGHQIMAQAFGGEVCKAEVGWVLGRQEHELSPDGVALFGPGPLAVLSFHQDQVVALPAGARRLLSNPASPNGGLVYDGFPALSVQFHPEFTPGFAGELLAAAAGLRLPEMQARAALDGLEAPLCGERVARGFAQFLRAHKLAEP